MPATESPDMPVTPAGRSRSTATPADIEAVLRKRYSEEHLHLFAGQAAGGSCTVAQFQKRFPQAPAALLDFYTWANNVRGGARGPKLPIQKEGPFVLATLEEIVEVTETMERIKHKDPENQWRDGF